MNEWHLKPTRLDTVVADTVARHATPYVEKSLEILTLAADERLLLAAAATFWLASRNKSDRIRRQGNHLAASVLTTAILPHLVKKLVSRQRPDRRVHGSRNGIPRSGKAKDSFPSGHAMHVAAIASAVSAEYPKLAPAAWTAAGFLAASRIFLLAHWTTDVAAGMAIGTVVERTLRKVQD